MLRYPSDNNDQIMVLLDTRGYSSKIMSILVQQYYQLMFYAVEVCVYNKQHYLNTRV